MIAYLREIHDQLMLEYIPDDYSYTRMAFYIQRNKFNTWIKRWPNAADAMQ